VVRRGISLRGRPYADRALSGESGSALDRILEDQQQLLAFAPVSGTPWVLLVQQPSELAFRPAQRDFTYGIGLLGIAAISALVIGVYLGTRLSRSYERERQARSASDRYAEELKRVSVENEQRRRFLERLIVSAPIPIAITRGPEHRLITVNPRYQMLKPALPMVGRTMSEVFPEISASGLVDRLDMAYRTGRESTLVDQPRIFADSSTGDEEQFFTIVYAPYDDAEGHPDGVLIIALETTEAVRVRLQAEREKDEFLSTASHELKTPLTAMALAAQVIERILARPDARVDDERLRRSVHGMVRQVVRAKDLINDLLEVSRLQGTGPSIRTSPMDLGALVQDAARQMSDSLAEGDPHTIQVDVPAEPLMVLGDDLRLEQVLTNLLSNALKYSPERESVLVQACPRGAIAELRVIDQGMGVSDEERGLLFLPFSRTIAARDSSIEGTGLGLYITRQIVERHGGSIHYEPTPGGGATFVVMLPLANSSSPAVESLAIA
jgi:signal transduction histidine kinase